MIPLLLPGKGLSTDEAIERMKTALSVGANFWDAAEYYGTPDWNSLHLLNVYFTRYPEDVDRVIVSVKGCFDRDTAGPQNDREGVQKSVENCLRILDGKCGIDVFSPGRVDPEVPIEETIGVLAEYMQSNKINSIGLSECSAQYLRRAHAVHPISAVEVELSLFETSILSNGRSFYLRRTRRDPNNRLQPPQSRLPKRSVPEARRHASQRRQKTLPSLSTRRF
jgi:pyridoxine 4-dehydrogenase